jgi:hypothetical protein
MAEDKKSPIHGELSSASQRAADAERIALANQDVSILKESADLQKQIVNTLREELLLIEQIKDGKKSLTDLTKLESDKAELLLKAKQSQNILGNTEGKSAENQAIQMESVLSSVDKIKGITEKDVGLNKVKNSLLGKAEANMGMLSALTGGLAPKAIKFMRAMNANPIILIVSLVVGLVRMMLEVGNAAAEIGRNLGVGAGEARAINQSFNQIAASSKDFTQTAEKIGQAMNLINEGLGTSATIFSSEILDTMASLQHRMGLTAEATFGLYQAASLSGKSMEETYLSAFATSIEVGKQTGVLLDHKSILEETGKITGQIRAQLGGSTDAITAAISKARAFGMELKEVASAGKQLLDFEQSISAELEAELITGRQLNLEKARLAALTGDYELLTEEINANVGDFHEFSKLNVLQQEQLARAVGMEANQLSNVLMKRANLDQLAQEAEARGERELANSYMQLSLQQKFAAAIEKLKVLVVNIVTRLEGGFSFMDLIGGNFLDEGLLSTSSPEYTGAFQDNKMEKAVERGLSKARISVSTRYNALDNVEGSNHQNVKFTSKIADNN